MFKVVEPGTVVKEDEEAFTAPEEVARSILTVAVPLPVVVIGTETQKVYFPEHFGLKVELLL
jgi:hypothetical protein